ncbi:MAG: ATP-binding protein [Pseudomonadota bacterium]|nr:ATP-binding protein [Pseudomonadota bacterium]MDP1904388.1 ATP-binding protein [Pseudomonadota bacterium]MDP2354433.1 ATP-binding protein [Pseudomonadota bacterium]
MEDDDIPSLRQRLINWLFTPLYLWLLFSTVTGYLAAVNLSNRPYDLVLQERAKLLASRYSLSQGANEFELVQLFPEAEGEFLFALYDSQGHRLASSGRLPSPRPAEFSANASSLRNTQIADRKLRLLTLRVPGPGGDLLLVQAAEPIQARLALGRSILGNIVIPQFIFILIAGVAVWVGLRKGLEPLERLRRQVANRPRDDLRPLEETLAPHEVRPLIREVNALIERLKGLMESQRRFVADAAHQLRTPFAGLRAQAELARREEASTTVKEALDRICAGTQRCSRLVTQLLTLARNEPEARLQAPLILLDLGRIAQEAASHWAPEALRRDIDLGFEEDGRQLPVKGDEAGLRDLIDNLIDNAIHYTPAGGHVTVRVGYERGAWLKVEDDGPGIPPEQREQVFQRFHRIPGSGQPGSGLGLAIVHEVVVRHDAELELSEAVGGKGALFTVWFPHHGSGM